MTVEGSQCNAPYRCHIGATFPPQCGLGLNECNHNVIRVLAVGGGAAALVDICVSVTHRIRAGDAGVR